MAHRKEEDDDYIMGRRVLISAPWVDMSESDPVFVVATDKAEDVAAGVDKFTRDEMQRAVALLLRGRI